MHWKQIVSKVVGMHDGRTLSHEVLEAARFTAIELSKNNVPVAVIAKSVQVGWRTVYKWIAKEAADGIESLRSSKAPGPEPKLKEKQVADLLACISQPATKHGFKTELWTGPRLRHLIKERYNIEYHRKHLPRLLTRLGLCLKFPERRALEQDPEKVSDWKLNRFPKIIKKAKRTGSLLFYADESLISLIPYVGRTWTFPESKPTVVVSGKRGVHVGVTAAVNPGGRMCFEMALDGEYFTAKTFIRFLKKMHRDYQGRHLTLIVDGSSTHTAKIVEQFEEQNSKWLKIEILPAYSPEFNPTEDVWRLVKTKKLNAVALRTRGELREKATEAMKSVKNNKLQVMSFFD